MRKAVAYGLKLQEDTMKPFVWRCCCNDGVALINEIAIELLGLDESMQGKGFPTDPNAGESQRFNAYPFRGLCCVELLQPRTWSPRSRGRACDFSFWHILVLLLCNPVVILNDGRILTVVWSFSYATGRLKYINGHTTKARDSMNFRLDTETAF